MGKKGKFGSGGKGKRVRNIDYQEVMPSFLRRMHDKNPNPDPDNPALNNPLYMGSVFDESAKRERERNERIREKIKSGELEADGSRRLTDFEKPEIANLKEFLAKEGKALDGKTMKQLDDVIRKESISTVEEAKNQTGPTEVEKQIMQKTNSKTKKPGSSIGFVKQTGKKRKGDELRQKMRKKKKKKKTNKNALSFDPDGD